MQLDADARHHYFMLRRAAILRAQGNRGYHRDRRRDRLVECAERSRADQGRHGPRAPTSFQRSACDSARLKRRPLALGVVVGQDWQKNGRDRSRHVALFAEPGVSAGRASFAYVSHGYGTFGSGARTRGHLHAHMGGPVDREENQSYVGGEAILWPIVFIGPRIGLFRSVERHRTFATRGSSASISASASSTHDRHRSTLLSRRVSHVVLRLRSSTAAPTARAST